MTFIVNPRSGNGGTAARWPALEAYLRTLGLEGETRYTQGPGDARELCAEALGGGSSLVVAVGGDGTINEVANGFFANERAPEAHLGILPCGTGGDFIRTLGIPRNPYAAAGLLAAGGSRRIDVGRAEFRDAGGPKTVRYFVNIAEAGLGGAVVDRVNRTSKRFGGFVSFLAGTLATFATYQPGELALGVDGAPERILRAWNVVVGNGRFFGGGMKILPEAEPDDGLFDVMLVKDVPRSALFANVAAIYRGTHLSQEGVEHFRAREIRVRSACPLLLDLDGEQPGTTEATFTLLPGCLIVRGG